MKHGACWARCYTVVERNINPGFFSAWIWALLMLAEVSQLVWTLVYGGLLTLLFSGWVALADAWVVCFGLWSNAQRRASRLMSYWGVKERVTCGCQGMWYWALSPKFSASLWRRTVVRVFMQRWKGDSDLWMSGNVILGDEPWLV